MDLTSAHGRKGAADAGSEPVPRPDDDAGVPPRTAHHPGPLRLALGRVARRIADLVHDPGGTLRRRVEEMSYGYPVSVVVTADIAVVVAAIAAASLRSQYFDTGVPFIAVALLFACYPLLFLFDLSPKPAVFGLSALAAQALFLVQPVSPDCSPLVLTVMVGMIAAIAPKRASLFWMLLAVAEILIFYALGYAELVQVYVVAIVLGWMVGLMLRFQRQSLDQERENQQIRAAQAADDERRRIAREVHDVIAHSLSVTLLHLTAARHSLETDRDVDEAIDALGDAERLGRQAMADIRHTVGLLDQRPSAMTPEPGLDDIGDLVSDFVGAGLPVTYRLSGDAGSVSASTGLALYRISQESLSNIAKHAPGAAATVDIAVTPMEVTVQVRNTLPAGPAPRTGRGMGINGMRQRTATLNGNLSAGRSGDHWQVRARIPLAPGEVCPMTGIDDPLTIVREAITSLTRKRQEGM
ncbi:sensor histidine kinase [Nocardia spumae]|uniref:sensor histidine kinase n=1 Tax=Nocardia spumae TaxID=2887190 RepID=UPI001D1431B2|nr:histidine kinase [Nocardia spumae]